MRWSRLFEDLEEQLAEGRDAERAALDGEAERLRLSRLTLRERMSALVGSDAAVSAELADGTILRGSFAAMGENWMAVAIAPALAIVPTAAVQTLGLAHDPLVRSARAVPRSSSGPGGLTERMSFGFVMRDAARRRIPVAVHLVGGQTLTGTIDRAGADHLDIALHDAGAPRRMNQVAGHRVVPFSAIAWVRWDAARPTPGL